MTPAFAKSFASGLKNCRLVPIGPGMHYLPEENPKTIGSIVHDWLAELISEAGS